jgi:hypothetical protein
VLALAALLSLPSPDAHGGGLYQWKTPDGRVEIGPLPPPGVSATPWTPGQPEAAPAGARPEAPAAVVPAAAAPADAPRAARPPRSSGPALAKPKPPVSKTGDDCANLSAEARGMVNQVKNARRDIDQLEAKIDKLDNSELAYSHTECALHDSNGRLTHCRSGTFDRDSELASSKAALDKAQEKLDRAEEQARQAGIPAKCQ